MTHDTSTSDSTELPRQANSEPEAANDEQSADDGRTAERRYSEGDDDSPQVGRRRFMQGTAASIMAAGLLGALGGEATAAGNRDVILVAGKSTGEHAYEIEMEPGGTIQRARYGDSKDQPERGPDGTQRIRGSVWHWNVDSFAYTGEIDRVEANGSVAFYFLSGAFRDDKRIVVGGADSGTHKYMVGSNSADIDIARQTFESKDVDNGPRKTERSQTWDYVTGKIEDGRADVLSFEKGQPLQIVTVRQGHLEVNPYDPTRDLKQVTRPNKNAVILYSYMGDGPFTTFFQNFTKLSTVMEGYDKAVLLKHKNLSVPAYAKADDVRKPTRQNFEAIVRELVEQDYTIDLYIMSHGIGDTDLSQHGSRFVDAFKMSTGEFGTEDWYTVADIERFRASFQGNIPLRLVYQANCWGHKLNGAWRRLGATTSIGSRYVNFFPNQLVLFAKRWRYGLPAKEALKRANTRTTRNLVRKYLVTIDIPNTRDDDDWGQLSGNKLCPAISVLKGKGDCAKDYFVNRWLHTDEEWNDKDFTGWGFVNWSSEKQLSGDPTLQR